MTKSYPFGLLFVLSGALFAQSVSISSVPGLAASLPAANACTGKTSLLCAIPNLYGPYGLVLPNPGVASSFASGFQTNFAATATQLTLLPLASPASGFVYEYDSQTGLYARTSQSLGPVVTERGETIGRHKFSFGGTYQRFHFSKLDGVDLHNIPVVYRAVTWPAGDPALASQFISTQNSIDIKINQYTVNATYGLTNRLDLSVAIPFYETKFNVTSTATINRIAGTEPIVTPGASGSVVSCCSNGGPGPYGPVYANYFDPANPAGSTVRQFSNNGQTQQGDLYWNPSKNSAAGIGDVTVRVKENVYRSDRMSLSLLTDIRFPTGDANNFLGSGTYGVKPVAALSVRAGLLTPHVNLGYQWNGSSILGGDPTINSKGRLPGVAVYSVGSDIGVSKYVTLSADYLGQELVNAPRIGMVSFQSPGPLASTGQVGTFQSITPLGKQVYNQSDLAIGAKFSFFDHLLVTGNVIVALNDTGLRQKVIPLVALSYYF